MKKYTSVDSYVAEFSGITLKRLKEIRAIIRKAAPNAKEIISYNMPGYKQNGMLVYFAGYKYHIGFYPMPSGIKQFENKFGEYKYSKGAVQFPLDKPLPKKLITAIVKFRIKETSHILKGTIK